MTDKREAYIASEIGPVLAVADPVERYKAAREERALHSGVDRALMSIQRDVVIHLYDQEHTWAEVGELLGISGSRAEAIARGR